MLNIADESQKTKSERHASWTELFFDLIAAAGIAVLAHVLEGELDAARLGLYALLYLTFWVSWTTFMLYGNVAAGRTRVLRLLIGMFGLGVMAASVPGVEHVVLESGHDPLPVTVFTLAYIATRLYGANAWRRGEILVDFPVVQYSTGLLPWIVSIWADESWKPVLWVAGIGLDLVLILVVSGNSILIALQAKLAARSKAWRKPSSGARAPRRERIIRGVSVDSEHLSERLGLFVIIVLGESVIQIVKAAADTSYDLGLLATSVASFALLAGLFGLSVVFGYAGLPHLHAGRISTRAALGLHCLVTGVIATVSVSLAWVIQHDALLDEGRWLLCAGVASYFTLGVVTGVVSHSSDLMRTTSRIITGIVVPILLGFLARNMSGRTLVICLALVVLAHLWFEWRQTPAPVV